MTTTDDILKKLDNQNCTKGIIWDNDWTKEEQKQLLKIYYLITKNETKLFDLVYTYHECDSYEDIFRDYNYADIIDKKNGVRTALKNAKRYIKNANANANSNANMDVNTDAVSDDEGDIKMDVDDGDMDDMNYSYSSSDVSTITNSDSNDIDDEIVNLYTIEDLKWDKKYSCNSTSSISYSCHIFGDISKYFTLGSESNIL
jgi:hypothetical protein